MKRVLMIAYNFPPLLPGVRRTLALVRYFPDFDWKPEILTVKDVHSWAYDPTPLSEVQQNGVIVHRSESFDPYRLTQVLKGLRHIPESSGAPVAPRSETTGGKAASIQRYLRNHFYSPDDHAGWVSPATRLARKIVMNSPPDAIYSTSFPHSAHVVALRLKREFPQIPWLADFRDGWTQNADFFHQLSPRLRARGIRLEMDVASHADAIVAVSEPITAHFRRLQPDVAKTIATIPNGFDERDVQSAVPQRFDGFTLVYTGTIYGGRTAEPLFAAVARACQNHPGLAGELKLVFVGKFDRTLQELARQYNLADRLVLPGVKAYMESLGAQKAADVLAALVTDMPDVEIMLTQKIFEYVASGRPVWAVADSRSACAVLVKQLDAGIVCDPANPEDGARGIIQMYETVKQNRWKPVDPEKLRPYSRRQQTDQMAGILDSLVASQTKKP